MSNIMQSQGTERTVDTGNSATEPKGCFSDRIFFQIFVEYEEAAFVRYCPMKTENAGHISIAASTFHFAWVKLSTVLSTNLQNIPLLKENRDET